jgi:hypothetical protein
VIPAERGSRAIACFGPKPQGPPPDCEGVAATATLADLTVYPPLPTKHYSEALADTARNLLRARQAGLGRLRRAASPADQAQAAASLAEGHEAAAKVLRGAPVTPLDRSANVPLVAALDRTRKAYETLAEKANRKDWRGYARALSAVSQAERSLSESFRRLENYGLSVRTTTSP